MPYKDPKQEAAKVARYRQRKKEAIEKARTVLKDCAYFFHHLPETVKGLKRGENDTAYTQLQEWSANMVTSCEEAAAALPK